MATVEDDLNALYHPDDDKNDLYGRRSFNMSAPVTRPASMTTFKPAYPKDKKPVARKKATPKFYTAPTNLAPQATAAEKENMYKNKLVNTAEITAAPKSKLKISPSVIPPSI